MYLEILTPEKTIFEGSADSATFPGSSGSFQVLNNHAPMISSLAKGELKYQVKDAETSIMVDGGVVEVLRNKIIVLIESIQE